MNGNWWFRFGFSLGTRQAPPSVPRPYYFCGIGLIIVLLTVFAFWEIGGNGFITFDDPEYITENPHVRGGFTWPNIHWALTSSSYHHWHPLTWLSHTLDCRLYELRPRGHHFTSLAIHVVSSILLFAVLWRMTGAAGCSALVALLFAVHPLHVESVAWASERKDVLSSLFWMLTLGAYARYTAQLSVRWYLVVLATFALGLSAKPLLVTLPFVLLLLDYWPLGRFKSGRKLTPELGRRYFKHPALPLLIEKLPLFVLSAASAVLTYVVQSQFGTLKPGEWLPYHFRIGNALVSYAAYVGKTIWPSRLSIFYPHPGRDLSWLLAAGAALLLVGVSVCVVRLRRRFPYLVVGWLWYLGTLVPMIGIVQVGIHSRADHYTYLPLIGLFLIVVWGTSDLIARWHDVRWAGPLLAVGVLAPLVVCTRAQVLRWRNSETLYRHAIAVTTNNSWAHNNLGYYYWTLGQLEKAEQHLTEALRTDPDFPTARLNLGVVQLASGQVGQAVEQFEEVLRLEPNFPGAALNLALIYALSEDPKIKNPEAAVEYARRFCEMTQNQDPLAWKVLATALRQNGQLEESRAASARALGMSGGPGGIPLSGGDQALLESRESGANRPPP